jgi:anti-anti-sigma factor
VDGEAGVRVEHVGSSCAVVHVLGDVDLLSGAAIRDAIMAEVQRHPDRLLIDLNEVRYFGSAGVGILADALKLRPGLQVACANPFVLRVLEITGLHELLEIHPTAAEALAARPQSS